MAWWGSFPFLARSGGKLGGIAADAQAVVGLLFLVVDGHDVGFDLALAMAHAAGLVLEEARVAEPLGVVALGVVGAQVIQAPAAFGAEQRGAGGHLGAVADHLHLG